MGAFQITTILDFYFMKKNRTMTLKQSVLLSFALKYKTILQSIIRPPPQPKAELREGKALLTPLLARGGAERGVGRALPSLSSAFGRGGAGVLDFSKIFTRGISHTHMRASVTQFTPPPLSWGGEQFGTTQLLVGTKISYLAQHDSCVNFGPSLTALQFNVLYSTVKYYSVRNNTSVLILILPNTARFHFNSVRMNPALYCTVQYYTVLLQITLYYTMNRVILYCTVLYWLYY